VAVRVEVSAVYGGWRSWRTPCPTAEVAEGSVAVPEALAEGSADLVVAAVAEALVVLAVAIAAVAERREAGREFAMSKERVYV